MPKELLVSDESINSHNIIVLTDGIDTARFKKNPIMLLNHIRISNYSNKENGKNMILPLGTWKDLRKDGTKMFGTPVFDEQDEFALTIKGKFDRGIMRSASIGIVPLEVVRLKFDDKPDLYKILKSELREISFCDIPSNRNAVAFYDNSEKPLELSDVINLAAQSVGDNQPKIKTMDKFSFVPAMLGLSADATPEMVTAKITELQKLKADNLSLTSKNEELEAKVNAFHQSDIVNLVDKAISDKKILAAQKDAYIKLAEADLESTKSVLEAMQPMSDLNLSDFVETPIPNSGGGSTVKIDGLTFSELQRKDSNKLLRLKESDPTTFNSLYKSEFGKDYKF